MESSSTSTNQEEPLDLSLANINGELLDEQQQGVNLLLEAFGMCLQQQMFAALLLQSIGTPLPPNTSPLIVEESPEKENKCEVDKSVSVEEHESTPSPTEARRTTSAGKPDRRMVGKMCTRRVEANARERNRVQQLSKMFDQLRVCLPVAEEIKISKLATLKVASAYIGFLGSLLKDDSDKEEDFRVRLQSELESAKTLRK